MIAAKRNYLIERGREVKDKDPEPPTQIALWLKWFYAYGRTYILFPNGELGVKFW